MYTIGEISKIVEVSTDTLRFYDEIGLLKPIYVDTGNNYRYYSNEQIKIIMDILELKGYGFSLDKIKRLIGQNENELKMGLKERLRELYAERDKVNNAISLIESRLFNISTAGGIRNKSILIADDAIFIRMVLRDGLSKYGFIIHEAVNGRCAVEMYTAGKPDIVIINIEMPEMDGITAVGHIIKHDPSARIIMLSAHTEINVVLKSLLAGAMDYVQKPFQMETLMFAVMSLLEAPKILDREKLRQYVDGPINPNQIQISELIKGCLLHE